jgi:hypothetical protein
MPYADEIRRVTGRAGFEIVSLVTMVPHAPSAGLPPRPA